MIKTSNLIDLNEITLENYATYNERITYEIPRQWGVRNKTANKRVKRSNEELKQHIKEYQHKYYIEVTKIKRKQLKENS